MIKSIHQSTKIERQNVIDEMFKCQNGDCDNCGVCTIFKGTSPQAVYKDYIEGIREFSEIAREFNQRNRL